MAFNLPALPLRMVDNNADIVAGAKLYVYQSGTLTPVNSFTTAALNVAHANPVVADANGIYPAVFLAAGSYKLQYTNAADATIYQVDDYAVEIEGSQLSFPTSVKTANFTVTAGDRGKMFLVDASGAPGANILITADSNALTQGYPFIVANTGATGTVTIQGAGGQTVDGVGTIILSVQNSAVWLISKGAAGWQSIAKSGIGATATDILTATNTTLNITPETLATALWKKGTTVAGAATVTLGNGGLFHVTGDNWTCSDIDFAVSTDGRPAKLVIDGTGNTLTHGANLICPGARDLKLPQNSILDVVQDAGDRVIVSAGAPQEWTLIETQTALSSASLIFANLAGYSKIRFILNNMMPVTDSRFIQATISFDGGVTYITTTTYTNHYNGTATGDTNRIGFAGAALGGNAATDGGIGGDVTFLNMNIAQKTVAFSRMYLFDPTGVFAVINDGVHSQSAQSIVNAIKFEASGTGNIASGSIECWGKV